MSDYDVLISYARRDDEAQFVSKIKAALEVAGLNVWMDTVAMRTSQEWWKQICDNIERSDNFLLVISENSLGSEWCQKEIEHARKFGKRIIAFQYTNFDAQSVINSWRGKDWEQIARQNEEILNRIQWIKDYPLTLNFEKSVAQIVQDAMTDLYRTQAHTQLLSQAQAWRQEGKSPGFHIRDTALVAAEAWLKEWDDLTDDVKAKKQPVPTDEQRAFIAACRTAEDAERRRLRTLRVATGSAATVGIVALIVAILSFIGQQAATMRRDLASTEVAEAQITLVQVESDVQEGQARIESLRLAALENERLNQPAGNVETATLLGIQALKNAYTEQADTALVVALDRLYVRRAFLVPTNVSGGAANFVSSVAFSPDGRYVLIGAWDGITRLQEIMTGEEVHTFSEYEKYRVTSVAFSPDGAYVLTGSEDTTAKLWDAATGEEIRIFSGHTGRITSVMFSPDGHYVLTGSTYGDNSAKLWNTMTGEEIRTFSGHTNDVTSVAFSPDGRYVLTGSGDNTAKLWETATGAEVRTFSGHTNRVTSVAFSPDGHYVLTGSNDNTAKLWETATGAEVRTFSGHTNIVTSVAFSPDGSYVLTGSWDNTAKLWETATGAEARTFNGHLDVITSVAFSPDGRSVLTGANDSTARLWNAVISKKPRVLNEHSDTIYSVAFSPDGRYLLTGSGDTTVNLWNAMTNEKIRTFKGHTDGITSVVFSPDTHYVLAGSWDKTAELWDVATGESIHAFKGHTDGVTSVMFSPDGRYVLTGSRDNTAKLWDIATGEEIRTFKGHTDGVMSVAFSPDGHYVLTGSSDNTAKLWDVATGKQIHTFSDYSDVVAFTPNGQYVLMRSHDDNTNAYTSTLLDIVTGEKTRTFNTGYITSMVFSPDGRYMLIATDGFIAKLWDVKTDKVVRIFTGHTGVIESVAFSPDGRYVLTGSGDRTARLWDTDYRDFITYACTRVTRDFTVNERTQFKLYDNEPTCSQFATTENPLTSTPFSVWTPIASPTP